ncbi:MAG: phosphoenolpyruvate synthase [bacterium]
MKKPRLRSRRLRALTRSRRLVLWFNELGVNDVPLVGGKNASLGEMHRQLAPKGIVVPNGFATTAFAYRLFLKESKTDKKIRSILRDLATTNLTNLQQHGHAVRQAILATPFPKELQKSILASYRTLEKEFGKNVDVAVRSSATAEDLPDASFAGQQETFLNIRGPEMLLDACKRCYASLFTDRAISYRQEKKFDHFKIALSIGVEKMVRSDRAASGVMFSIDTESGFPNAVIINGSWGLGENIVQGTVTPDEWRVFKPTLAQGKGAILSRTLGDKKVKMVYTADRERPTKNIPTTTLERERFCLSEKDVLQLARWAVEIEQHYNKPMDMEWAKDGRSKRLYIVQARPETVMSRRDPKMLEEYRLLKRGKVVARGQSVGRKIGEGVVRVIDSVKNIKRFQPGEVLVTTMTDPDWEPIMKKAAAIITDKGGRTCHAAIVSRELGVPCIVGTGNGTRVLSSGHKVTVSCAEGEKGFVYDGIVPFSVHTVNVKNLKRPKTKVMTIAGDPGSAFSDAMIPNDGCGLARQEFIVASAIRIHPMALVRYPRLKDHAAKKQIEKLTAGYRDKQEYYVDKLTQGIATIAAAYYPKDVIVRLSDFKTNEYANLIGGKEFEPHEGNPMIGWRGASRYYDPKYREGFALECKAIRRVREKMGLTNLKIMVPFCRTVGEARMVLEEMKKHGLRRGVHGLQIYVMAEIPSNILLADQFAEVFDGFSIGSNDLAQLTLGIDRDSELVAHLYDERNDAVKQLLTRLIREAKKAGVHVGICGQAPSDFPEIAAFLVEQGIESISLNPDTVIKTTLTILEKEKHLGRKKK